jgi:hypothetical protein
MAWPSLSPSTLRHDVFFAGLRRFRRPFPLHHGPCVSLQLRCTWRAMYRRYRQGHRNHAEYDYPAPRTRCNACFCASARVSLSVWLMGNQRASPAPFCASKAQGPEFEAGTQDGRGRYRHGGCKESDCRPMVCGAEERHGVASRSPCQRSGTMFLLLRGAETKYIAELVHTARLLAGDPSLDTNAV